MLSLPLKVDATSWIRFSLWGGDDTSHTDPVTLNPSLCHSSKHLSRSVWVLEQVCTTAPNAAKSLTMACLKHSLKQVNLSDKNKVKRTMIKEKVRWDDEERVMKTNPIPRVPPVTRAVIPLRDHLPPLLLLLISGSAIFLCFFFL